MNVEFHSKCIEEEEAVNIDLITTTLDGVSPRDVNVKAGRPDKNVYHLKCSEFLTKLLFGSASFLK